MVIKTDNAKKIMRKTAVILFWLLLWQLVSLAVGNYVLMVGPWETLLRFLSLLGEMHFYGIVGMSLLRIGAGFLTGFLTGVLFAACSSRFRLLEEGLAPVMSLLKAVPVASFVVLLLIWWGSSFLAVAVCFLVVMPNIYINTLEGLKSTDSALLEMGKVFRLPLGTKIFYIYLPALRPFLTGGLKLALGMCWKSGVAAEVIGTPAHSIGGQLYLSKVYLDTAGVFAWTVAVILLSVLFERLILLGVGRIFIWQPACSAPADVPEMPEAVVLKGLEKRFKLPEGTGYQQVINCLSAVYEPGRIYYLSSPSGSGKTTLLRILAGLAEADGGELTIPNAVSMVFQEDRLCMDCSALKNVEMVTGDASRAEEALGMLLEPEDLEKTCTSLSGGMKRRVALARAMEARSQLVLLDEPFTGMDAETKERAEKYILDRQQGRTLIIATHI